MVALMHKLGEHQGQMTYYPGTMNVCTNSDGISSTCC